MNQASIKHLSSIRPEVLPTYIAAVGGTPQESQCLLSCPTLKVLKGFRWCVCFRGVDSSPFIGTVIPAFAVSSKISILMHTTPVIRMSCLWWSRWCRWRRSWWSRPWHNLLRFAAIPSRWFKILKHVMGPLASKHHNREPDDVDSL